MRVKFLDLDKMDLRCEQAQSVISHEIGTGFVFHSDFDYHIVVDKIENAVEETPIVEGALYQFHVVCADTSKEETDHFVQLFVNWFLQSLILDERREREARLSAPIAVKTNRVIMLDLINKKTKINKFSLQVYVNGKLVYKF